MGALSHRRVLNAKPLLIIVLYNIARMKAVNVLLTGLIAFASLALAQPTGPKTYSESEPYIPLASPKKARLPLPNTALPPNAIFNSPIPVSVFDQNGNFVEGLKAENFTVIIGGRATPPRTVTFEPEPLKVAILIDRSPSGEAAERKMRDAALTVLNQFALVDEVMIATFDSRLNVLLDFSTDRKAQVKAINSSKMNSGTSIYDSIAGFLEKRMRRASGRKAVVLISDGFDTTSKAETFDSSLEKIERESVPIFPIWVDSVYADVPAAKIIAAGGVDPVEQRTVGRGYMAEIGRASGTRSMTDRQLHDLKPVKISIADELRRQYLLRVDPGTPGPRRTITIRIDKPGLTIVTRGSDPGA